MKILVLGSEGFVGHNLVQGLEKSHQVLCADQLENSSHKNYSRFNIVNADSVQKTVRDVDIVIDLVAHALTSSLEDIVTNAQINIIGLLNVLEACKKNGVKKVIFTSASSMVGVPQSYDVSESHPVNPKTAYGITKMASEHYLRLYHEMFGMNYVIFRFFNIYGPYQKNGLIPSIYDKVSTGQPVTVFGKGDQVRDYVYIEDAVPFFEKAASTTVGDNGVFNLGTGIGTRIMEVIDNFSRILGKEIKIDHRPPRAGEIGNFVADTRLLSSTFNFTPKTGIEQGLKKTIEWLKNKPS